MSCAIPIVCGELHYPRIPREYWRARLKMARAMGLNAVSTYVFWNFHERQPGTYDFSGEADVAQFAAIAQEEGLDVILRPGPYVCAEWDLGGLPAWLLRDGGGEHLRTTDGAYMMPVRRWLLRLGQELAPLQAVHGGPIVAVQLENEYGAFGSDARYLGALREAYEAAGFDLSPLFTIDQPGDLVAGSLPDLPIAVTFAPGDPAHVFERVRSVRPDAPLLVGEYWAGWFDHWGEKRERLDAGQQAIDLQWMLERGASVNVYMFHGGTNFGFWNGANSSETVPYQPTTTSYDYEAALDEAGRPTPKYFAFREAIARAAGRDAPEVPPAPLTIDVPAFSLDSCAAFMDAAAPPVESDSPLPMEAIGQQSGFLLYRTIVEGPFDALLQVDEVRDYAVVMLDDAVAGRLDRRSMTSSVRVASRHAYAKLEILVENCGRINYGPGLRFEQKGITRRVTLGARELLDWQLFALPFDDLGALRFQEGTSSKPAFYRGSFFIERPEGTFLDVRDLGKGALWVNGRNAGRFWNIGPQRALYVPGSWLHPGENEAVAFDLFPHEQAPRLRGVSERQS